MHAVILEFDTCESSRTFWNANSIIFYKTLFTLMHGNIHFCVVKRLISLRYNIINIRRNNYPVFVCFMVHCISLFIARKNVYGDNEKKKC